MNRSTARLAATVYRWDLLAKRKIQRVTRRELLSAIRYYIVALTLILSFTEEE